MERCGNGTVDDLREVKSNVAYPVLLSGVERTTITAILSILLSSWLEQFYASRANIGFCVEL